MKKIFITILLILLSSILALYLGIVFILPQVINNKAVINKLESLILDKTGIETNIEGLDLKVSPKLDFDLNITDINSKYKDVSVFDIKDLSLNYKLLENRLTTIDINEAYIDGNILKQFNKKPEQKHKNKFELAKCPETHIKKITFKSDDIIVYAKDIDAEKEKIHLKADIKTKRIKETIKIGYLGSFQIIKNSLKANQFEIKLGNSHLFVNGYIINKDKTFDLSLTGEKLPVSEIMPIILHLQKYQDPSRKFIENFKNFKGTANVDLKINKEGIFGKCVGNNLSANAVWFDIPLYFKEAVFNFRGQKVDSVAEGILGKEKVIHTLNITDLLNPQKKYVIGTMKTTLTKKFDYVPNLTVLNSVNVKLIYKIKNKKPDVYYNIDIPTNSDLIYNSFYLGLREFERKIYGNTFKDNDDLFIKKYKYSYFDSEKEQVIISGDGLFIKNIDKLDPDKFIPQYVTCHTNGYAPISVTGSFGEKVRGGEFKGDLKYDFKNNQLLGTFDVVKARHKAFLIEKAHVVSENGVFNITSNGLFKDEKYLAELNLKNNIYGETLIYDMKLFLDKLTFETKSNKNKPKIKLTPEDITKKVKDIDITINNWEIIINEIKRDSFILKNVKLIGSMKNNIFDFKMEDLNFADGIIRAKGIYNFVKNTSQITFEAKNINSNKVAQMTLNLKDQIEGIANAKVELDAKDIFRFLDAHCIFEVKEGFLPKLGDKEFMIKNSKYKLSQITNLDLTKKDLMKDDIKGSFDVHNTEIKNINITTWHELSAIFLEGNYEMEKQHADLQVFWHYSKKAPKGVRIFGIPLSLILKVVFRPEKSKELYRSELSKIPKINDTEKNSKYYRVHLKGNINNNKLNIILKEIK